MQGVKYLNKIKKLRKVLSKSVPLWLVLIVMISGVAVAITVYGLTAEKISLFKGGVTGSDFVVECVVTKTKGLNKIVIKVVIKNTDTATHSANVTVSLLGENGDILTVNGIEMTITLQTGEVAGGASVKLVFTFTGAGLVELFENYLIEIYQTG